MKKLVLSILYFILFCFVSCNLKQNPPFDNHFIKLIAQNIEPSPYIGIPLFCRGDDNKILQVEAREFYMIYNDGKFNMSYISFLKKALNQQLILQPTRQIYSFYIDENVANEYNTKSFIEFIYFYCEDSGEGRFTLKRGYTKNQKESIFYFLFINNYLSCYDDYSGFYSIFSTTNYLKNNWKF